MKSINKTNQTAVLQFLRCPNNQTKFVKVASLMFLAAGVILISDNVYAADTDAFGKMFTKVEGWVTGSLGKFVTFSSLVLGLVMGVMGFPFKHIAGAVGIGLGLSASSSIVNMIF